MHFFAVLISIAVVSAALDRETYEQRFVNWMNSFNIKFSNGVDFVKYLNNFIENDKIIEAHNALNSTYTLGHNQFSHMNRDDWKAYLRLSVRPEPVEPISVHPEPTDMSTIPDSLDWTTKGAVQVIKDQGQCGSCWAFSTIAGIESVSFIKYGKLNSLSEQNVVDCDKTDSACNGGYMSNAVTWVEKNGGVCSEADYPYTSGTTEKAGTCKTSCSKVANSTPKGYTTVTKNSDSAMLSALQIAPVIVAIEADQPAFQLYKSGVLTGKCGTSTDHGVLTVGYGTLSGTDYYKVKNSWGTSWGESGYVLIERGVSQKGGQCGILTDPIYAVIA